MSNPYLKIPPSQEYSTMIWLFNKSTIKWHTCRSWITFSLRLWWVLVWLTGHRNSIQRNPVSTLINTDYYSLPHNLDSICLRRSQGFTSHRHQSLARNEVSQHYPYHYHTGSPGKHQPFGYIPCNILVLSVKDRLPTRYLLLFSSVAQGPLLAY